MPDETDDFRPVIEAVALEVMKTVDLYLSSEMAPQELRDLVGQSLSAFVERAVIMLRQIEFAAVQKAAVFPN